MMGDQVRADIVLSARYNYKGAIVRLKSNVM